MNNLFNSFQLRKTTIQMAMEVNAGHDFWGMVMIVW